MNSKHIEIKSRDGALELIVDDYELFDYLDDVLTENGLEFEFTNEEVRDGHRFYKMHFGANVKEVHLTEIIEGIPTAEIQRIWELNNPTGETGGT